MALIEDGKDIYISFPSYLLADLTLNAQALSSQQRRRSAEQTFTSD